MTRRRRVLLGWAALLMLVLVWLALCFRFIVHPRIDPVEHVDAMYVIGPVDTRWSEALIRGDEGIATEFLATQNLVDGGPEVFPPNCGEQRAGYVVTCVIPDPYTTRGEARLLAEQVRDNGWTHVAVFTSTPHVARTRMLMERCVPAQVSVWDYPRERSVIEWLGQFLYQSAAWVKAQLLRSC